MCNLTDSTHQEMLWQQHCATWIPTNCPGAGHILIHDNGINRANPSYTSIDEITPPVDANGFYSRVGNTYFGPTNYFWQYTNNPATNFYGADIGGAEREPNGDTLITFGIRGTLFEVTSNLQTIWNYINPVTTTPLAQGSTIPFDPNSNTNFPLETLNEVFKVHRYATNFSGFAGKDLTPRGTIETYIGAATDTVGLGLPDIWARAHFGTLSAVTATSSHSGNGLTDIQEYQYGLDPNVWSSANDGIPDGWAIAYGFDPTSASTASIIDPNGYTTLQSYIADLDPTNPTSCLVIQNLSMTEGYAVYFQGSTNQVYTLFYTTNLSAGAWNEVPVQTIIRGTEGVRPLVDVSPADTQRFYRVGSSVSNLWLQNVGWFSGATVSFTSSSNRTYTLYYTTNLTSGVWTNIPSQTGIPGIGGLDTLTDPSSADSQRFYRIGVALP